MKEFKPSDLSETGVLFTAEGEDSPIWTKSAALATKIANDSEFQKAVEVFTSLKGNAKDNEHVEAFAIAMAACDELTTRKFGDLPGFDPIVQQAAFLAVLRELHTRRNH